MPICKLCKEEKTLLRKSHIIPDFLYQELYDAKHRLRKFDAIEKAKGVAKVFTPQSGEYEGGLLCQACDGGKIGQFETYLANILNNNSLSEEQRLVCEEIVNETGVEFTRVSNLDYNKLKLALLSILWRASISKRDVFSEVSLGPYEEKIRTQLDSEISGNDNDISIIVMSWHNDKKTAKDIIGQPRRHKENGKTYYSFVINGFIVIFYITPSSVRKEMEPFRLQSDGTLSIIHLPKGRGMEFMVDYSGASLKTKK